MYADFKCTGRVKQYSVLNIRKCYTCFYCTEKRTLNSLQDLFFCDPCKEKGHGCVNFFELFL